MQTLVILKLFQNSFIIFKLMRYNYLLEKKSIDQDGIVWM